MSKDKITLSWHSEEHSQDIELTYYVPADVSLNDLEYDLLDMFKRFLIARGYGSEAVDEYMGIE